MPGFLVHAGATVMCAHGGSAMPTAPNPRVMVSGQPTVLVPMPFTIAGCPFVVSGAPVPCITATWLTGSTRVLSNGMPMVVLSSQAICVPNGTPLMIAVTQVRVNAM